MNKSKYNPIILNRDKIETIGTIAKTVPTVKIKEIYVDTNEVKTEIEIYKTIRRKNKVFGYGLFGERIEMTFENTKSAKRFKEQFKKAIKNE